MTHHADKVYSLARSRPSQAASSPVAASWLRCMNLHKLAPDQVLPPARLTDKEFRDATDRSRMMVEEARDELDRLFSMTGRVVRPETTMRFAMSGSGQAPSGARQASARTGLARRSPTSVRRPSSATSISCPRTRD
jgi:hypothetical protein